MWWEWLIWKSLDHEARKILEELVRLHSTDVVLPFLDGREHRLRCVVNPEPARKILLDHLGLRLPKRLNRPGIPEV